MAEMMAELTGWQSGIVIIIVSVAVIGIIGPWLSLFSLNGIERELGLIRRKLEERKEK